MVERVPGWLERVLLPQISEVKGELKAMNALINGLEGKWRENSRQSIPKLGEWNRSLVPRLMDSTGG